MQWEKPEDLIQATSGFRSVSEITAAAGWRIAEAKSQRVYSDRVHPTFWSGQDPKGKLAARASSEHHMSPV